MAISLLQFKLESGEGHVTCNLKVMRHLNYDQGTVMLTRELATLSALVAEAKFVRPERDQVLAGMERFLWLGLACMR